MPGGWKEAEPEASGQEEPDGRESTDKCALEAKVRPWSFDVHALPAQPVGVLPLFICLVSSYRKGSQSPYSWVTFCKKRQELFTLVTEVRKGGLSGSVLPWTRRLDQAPPELPQRPALCSWLMPGHLNPGLPNSTAAEGAGAPTGGDPQLALVREPQPRPPQPGGSGAHRTLSERSFPSPSRSACGGGGSWAWPASRAPGVPSTPQNTSPSVD